MFPLLTKMVRYTGTALALQEFLYGFVMSLLMVFAARLDMIGGTREEVITLILGMNITWGVIDAIIFYLVDRAEHNRNIRILSKDCSEDEKRALIKRNLFGTVVTLMDDEDEERIIDQIMNGNIEPKHKTNTERRVLLNAILCASITTMASFPAVVSLILVPGYNEALVVATLMSGVCMFFVGHRLGPYLGLNRWTSALFLLFLAVAISLVATFTGG